ncbi:integrase [Pseudomonas cavernicola]|uniref:Integrase n=1 Tax=Pseudomonas cavernicola TaxID=2320866 RepID=A0A418XMH6_9PSED|nr:VPA1269 family protein [Pseudomonas cavernicola]RJG13654.1 integrase [Pseudomonas cavernicola]
MVVKNKLKKYSTYIEAQAAVRALGIQSSTDYKRHYKQDPRLPSHPHVVYAGIGWEDWYKFLGVEKIELYTYAEAKLAIKRLGLKDSVEYKRRFKEDRRLPSNPHVAYKNKGWVAFLDFFDRPNRLIYPTYEEARAAVRVLKIRSVQQYLLRYGEDPLLPHKPDSYYRDCGWVDWYDFFGKGKPYSTYLEARAAALALGVKNSTEYFLRRSEDPRLPRSPSNVYARKGWVNWYVFLGNESPDFYRTYTEARSAVQKLQINNIKEYKKHYSQDSKLPCQPDLVYSDEWVDWYDFLNKERSTLYYEYFDAKLAVQKLTILSYKDYLKRYQEDPRLPCNPNYHYEGKGWVSWNEFLGIGRNIYFTYAEAQTAAQKLGIQTSHEYKRRYREDPKLPSSPNSYYAGVGWTDVYDFLGRERPDYYQTYEEAQAAVKALGIQSMDEYRDRYREDPRLSPQPHVLYLFNGWSGGYAFLGKEKPVYFPAGYPKMLEEAEKWLATQVGIAAKRKSIKIFLSFIESQKYPDDPRYLLLRSNKFDVNVYICLVESQAESMRRPLHSNVQAFYQWVLDEHCTDVDGSEKIVLPEYRNPFSSILSGFLDGLPSYRPSQSTKPPLGYEFILRARNFLVPNGFQTLGDMPHLQEFFNSYTDWIDIDESKLDKNDPNCVWRYLENAERRIDGRRERVNTFQIWTPVRFVALYTLLRYPLRGQQILWLDGGEADKEIAVRDADGQIRWVENAGPLVGRGTKKRRAQAAVQRGASDAPKLFVTTNKTGRREGGYDVEWIPDDLVYWFLLLRDWQAKYLPLSEPTPWDEIKVRAETNSKILKSRGTQCFLFRTDSSGQPLHTTTAFSHLLPALLHAIQRPGEDLAYPSEINKGRFISPYTPHSLRVSLITAYIADGNAPIHLIAKLVGHSSLVMTIYYTKLNNEQMRRPMGEVEKRIALLAADREIEMLKTHGLHSLSSQLIATDGNRSLIESNVPNTACVIFDWGICPMSAASCHLGGECLTERKAESIYAPVEAGYLGQKNCLRCRFFITGVPFYGGLTALWNEISLESHTEVERYNSFTAEVDRLERDQYDALKEGRAFLYESDRKRAIANQQQSASKLDALLNDAVFAYRFMLGCEELIKESAEIKDGIRLIAGGDLYEVGVAIEESKTNYHLLAEICQNATIYQSSNPSRAIPLIAQAIDRMAENNGLKPAMFRLTDQKKLVVCNELNRLLLQRLGSWERIDDLFAGDLMLLDIDAHQPELKRISPEIQLLLSSGGTVKTALAEDLIYE